MRYRKFYLFLFSFLVLSLTAALGWNGYRTYAFEKTKVVTEINSIISGIASRIQSENITLLNNAARMLTDKEVHEKIAFAAGFTRNEGKMNVAFGEDTTRPEKTENKNPPLNVNKEFIITHDLKFDAQKVKGPALFDSLFKAQLAKKGWKMPFAVRKTIRHEKQLPGILYSEAFIFDFFDPVMYRMEFSLPVSMVLKEMLPEIITSLCVLLLLIGSCTFFYKSYLLQSQMSSFKESLFSNVTHELKSPLASLQLIIDEAAESQPLSPEHRNFAIRELNRMSLLVEKIISFGKMTREQIEMNKTLADVGSVAREVLEVQSVMIKRLKGSVNIEVQGNAEVYADKALLTNVLITLLDNALKYNNTSPKVHITVTGSGREVVVSIADNGIGIASAFHQKIFEPFFRVPEKDRHNVKGHGLGLSFVKQVMEMHSGKVSVESGLGKGACFTITLPKA